MGILLPLPEGISYLDWAGAIINYEVDPNIAFPTTEENWQDWASSVLSAPTFYLYDVPNPYEFSDWREWARRLLEVAY